MGLKDRLAASASRLSLASTLRPQDDPEDVLDEDFERGFWESKSMYSTDGDDNASVFSFAPTLVNARLGYSAGDVSPAFQPLPKDQIFGSFISSYKIGPPKPAPFSRNGLPARVQRGENRSLRTRWQKAIIVQFPLRIVGHVGLHPHPRGLKDIAERRAQYAATRNIRGIGTVYDFERIDLVGLRERELMGLVVKTLMMGGDSVHPHLIYPVETIRRAPPRFKRKDGSAIATVEWATLRLLSPESPAAAVSPAAAAAASTSTSAKIFTEPKETDDELLERLFEPTESAEQVLDQVLEHLDRRGAVWTHAGHFTQASNRNPDPKTRIELTIHGLFPTYLLDRFKKYRRSGWLPMPADTAGLTEAEPPLDVKGKGKKGDSDAPLILHSVSERLRSSSSTSSAAETGLNADSQWRRDVLEGWSVGVTIEPYRKPVGIWGQNAPGVGMVATTI